MKALQIHVVNVASFQLVSGGQRWYIVGCYLAPDNSLTTEDVVAFIIQRPQGATLLVDGDFNNDLAAPEGWAQEKEIVAALAVTEMEDMSAYFLPHNKSWLKDIKTWFMRRGVWEVRSQTYYILGTYRRLIQNVEVRDTQHNMDH